ncbi:MAG: SufBD protein [Clostridia bacterium]|nr:SufBD protein [Clostridia bacterium]
MVIKMTKLQELINSLFDKNNTVACGAMKTLAELSEKSDEVYAYMDTFAEMLESGNSYVRNRGLRLIAVNARWDNEFKIDEIIDDYLKHITDKKPITARQCIAYLPEIAKYKPDCREEILTALNRADISHYPDSMRSLVFKDIKNAIREVNGCE